MTNKKIRNKKKSLKNISEIFPKEILFNLIKFNPTDIIKYLLKKNLIFDWKKIYYFIFKENVINPPYLYPYNYENIWINGIINRSSILENSNFKNKNYKIVKNGNLMLSTNKLTRLGSKKNKKLQYVTDKSGKKIKNVSKIYSTKENQFILLKNGKIMSCGNNEHGQLGFNDYSERNKFELIPNVKNVKHIILSSNDKIVKHVFLILKNGNLMYCGKKIFDCSRINYYKFDNLGFKFAYDTQVQKESDQLEDNKKIKNIKNIFHKNNITIALIKNGKIMACETDPYGMNTKSCMNLSSRCLEFITKDKLGYEIKNVERVFLGDQTIFLLLKDGVLMCAGNNETGILGFGDRNDRSKFELIPDVKNVVQLFFDYFYVILLLSTGEIMICNDFDSINNDFEFDNKQENKYNLVKNIKNVKDIKLSYSEIKLFFQDGTNKIYILNKIDD